MGAFLCYPRLPLRNDTNARVTHSEELQNFLQRKHKCIAQFYCRNILTFNTCNYIQDHSK